MADRTDSPKFEFDRAQLEESSVTKTIRCDIDGIDRLSRTLEERFGDDLETCSIASDGDATRLSALIDTGIRRSRTYSYKPYGPHGAMAVIVGLIAALPTIFVSLLLTAIGYYFYRSERDGSLPLKRWMVVDVLLTPADDSTPENSGIGDGSTETTSADVDSSATVTLAVEPAVGIDTDRLVDLPWTQRKAIVERVSIWSDRICKDEYTERNGEDIFFDNLTMWLKRKSEADLETVESTQRRLLRTPETRRRYSGFVADGEERRTSETAEFESLLSDIETAISN